MKENFGPESYTSYQFQIKDSGTVMLKFGLSFVSIENTKENLLAEQPGK